MRHAVTRNLVNEGFTALGLCLALVCTLALTACRMQPPDTPLTAAAWAGRTEEVKALLDGGSPVDDETSYGLSALVLAGRAGHVDIVKLLLAHGADPDALDHRRTGWTPMIHATHTGQNEVVMTLLAAGAKPDATSRNGTTALMMAAGEGNRDIVRALLDRGADARMETSDGVSALTNAVAEGDLEIVKMLLASTPDLQLKDGLANDISKLVARLRGKKEILALLKKNG